MYMYMSPRARSIHLQPIFPNLRLASDRRNYMCTCNSPLMFLCLPGTTYQVPSTRYQVPGTRHQVPSTRYQVSGTNTAGYRVSGTKYQV